MTELKNEPPYLKKSPEQIRQIIQKAFPNAPEDIQNRLIDIFGEVDARLFDFHNNLLSVRNDNEQLLKFAYVRAQVVQEIYKREVELRLAEPMALPLLVASLDDYLKIVMIRGSV